MEPVEEFYLRESAKSLLTAFTRRVDLLFDFAFGMAKKTFGVDAVEAPLAVIKELSAVIELYRWERDGIDVVKAGLPNYRDALAELRHRVTNYSPDFEPVLAEQTFFFWLRNFAWASQEEFGDAMLVEARLDDQSLEMIAKFLWSQRKMLASDLTSSQSAPA